MIAMRDGVRLSTDLYFPECAGRSLPVILTRTPYDKRTFRDPASEVWKFVAAGFVVAVQDLRGTHESEGECRVSVHERADGYDAVEWLAAQPWSNGRVGTYGCSHRGEVQYQLAALRPPALACAIVQAGASVLHGETSRSYMHMGGVVNLGIASWYRRWQNTLRPQFPPGSDAAAIRQASPYYPLAPVFEEMRYPEDFHDLPIVDVLDRVGSPPCEWRERVSHPPGDPWWRQKGLVTGDDEFDAPMLHVNSWFDFGVHETLVMADLVRARSTSERARRNQYVVVSAAGHCGSETLRPGDRIGELDLGDPSYDFFGLYIRWFRHWLEGDGGDFQGEPRVRYFLLNGNEWRTADAWPPADTRETRLFLSSRNGANSLAGDGRLTPAAPERPGCDGFDYDPLNPVPTAGGVMWSPGTPPAIPMGPTDQTEVQRRRDVLVYTSDPFVHGMELVGPVSVDLHVRSSAPDTDFTAKLTYVTPQGRALWLTEGILRLRYWAGIDAARLVTPATVVPLRIDLKATAFAIEPGSRLRLEVSSSNFPRFERNLNTGGNNFDESVPVVAHNEVLHSAAQPSALRLWLRTSAGDPQA